MLSFFRPRDRGQSSSPEFPENFREILRYFCPIYTRLNNADQRELETRIDAFLKQKHFEGCSGLVLCDEMRVTIAAYACLLLLHREAGLYPKLHSVLVYPSTFYASGEGLRFQTDPPDTSPMLGQSSHWGAVVLAWDAVAEDRLHPHDGRNLVIHEFAHQLDEENGLTDGVPELGAGEGLIRRFKRHKAWAKVFLAEYDAFCRAIEEGRPVMLDTYAATNAIEFFAVCSEAFFEMPHQLRGRHQPIYEQLHEFYEQDPIQWTPLPAEDSFRD